MNQCLNIGAYNVACVLDGASSKANSFWAPGAFSQPLFVSAVSSCFSQDCLCAGHKNATTNNNKQTDKPSRLEGMHSGKARAAC